MKTRPWFDLTLQLTEKTKPGHAGFYFAGVSQQFGSQR
jgi:hypothetical protein